MARHLILGTGYIGAAIAARALDAGDEAVLADNWFATAEEQLDVLRERGADVRTADIRDRAAIDALLEPPPDRVHLLAAQASRPLSFEDPDYTEETNLLGARRVAEAVAAAGGPPLLYASSSHVYGPGLEGTVTPDRPYGRQGDLSHLSKVYAELCLDLYARRHGFGVALLRLGIVYGPSPVEHDRLESVTVVDKFRRLAARGQPLPLDDGGRATIGVVHVDDVARIFHELPPPKGVRAQNVVAESVTVGRVAALARGEVDGAEPAYDYSSPFTYEHDLARYLAEPR